MILRNEVKQIRNEWMKMPVEETGNIATFVKMITDLGYRVEIERFTPSDHGEMKYIGVHSSDYDYADVWVYELHDQHRDFTIAKTSCIVLVADEMTNFSDMLHADRIEYPKYVFTHFRDLYYATRSDNDSEPRLDEICDLMVEHISYIQYAHFGTHICTLGVMVDGRIQFGDSKYFVDVVRLVLEGDDELDAGGILLLMEESWVLNTFLNQDIQDRNDANTIAVFSDRDFEGWDDDDYSCLELIEQDDQDLESEFLEIE